MAMTTGSFRKKLEKIRQLESDLRGYKEKCHLYETLVLADSLSSEERDYAEMKADYYQYACLHTIARIRELKNELSDICNVQAFGYDSPCVMDDSYYDRKFRTDGYFNGIRL